MEIQGWEHHRKEMKGKVLKDSLELRQEIHNRIDNIKVELMSLCLKADQFFLFFVFLKIICHISLGNNLMLQVKSLNDVFDVSLSS